MSQKISLITISLLMLLLSGCERQSKETAVDTDAGAITIYTVNYPLQYFAASIGGEFVDARYPGPAESDPAFWIPATKDVRKYQQADLIVLNGAGYASWLKAVSLPLGSQLDTSSAFADRLLPAADTAAHKHGPGGEHVHDELAFTVWLDPELAKLQATAIHDALEKLLPEQKTILDANLIGLADALWALDEEFARAFKYRNRERIIYSHPVYQYLDKRYELDGTAMHWEPDEMPSDKDFAKLEGMEGALMIWEADPRREISERLAEMGISIAVFETAAAPPASGDYLDIMRANLERLKPALL